MRFSKKNTIGSLDLSLTSGTPKKHAIEPPRFITYSFRLKHHPYMQLNRTERENIIKYSQQDNNVIEIFQIEDDKVETLYYKDCMPLVVIKECNFYSQKILTAHVKRYLDFILSGDNGKRLFEQVVEEMLVFAELGYIFYDQSANNILVNADFSDFRLIDVQSIGPAVPFILDPVRVLLGAKYATGSQDSDFLLTEFITPHMTEILKKIRTIPAITVHL